MRHCNSGKLITNCEVTKTNITRPISYTDLIGSWALPFKGVFITCKGFIILINNNNDDVIPDWDVC